MQIDHLTDEQRAALAQLFKDNQIKQAAALMQELKVATCGVCVELTTVRAWLQYWHDTNELYEAHDP